MKERSADCAAIRDLMLDAAPAELRAQDDSPLALHLRGCTQCSRAAAQILDAQSELDAALRTLTLAGAAAAPRTAVARAPDSPIADVRRHRRRWLLLPAPLAAAALIALLVVFRGGDGGTEPQPPRVALADDAPVVNVTGSDDVAIMRTSNPNITVVWYLNRENR